MIIPYAAAAVPGGFLSCDGAAVSRTTYAALFAAIGIAYGPGDGSTTFNVPDLRGRSPIGAGTGLGLTPRALGDSGGAEVISLITGEMPAHDHSYDRASSLQGVTSGSDFSAPSVADTPNTGSSGSGSAHDNMPPFGVAAWLIKT